MYLSVVGGSSLVDATHILNFILYLLWYYKIMAETKKILEMPSVEGKSPEKTYEENKHKKLDISRTLKMELEEYTPQLQKLAKYVIKSESFDAISELCNLAGCNEKYVRADIEKQMEENRDFIAFLIRLAGSLDKMRIPLVRQMLYQTALDRQDYNVARTYLQSVGAFGTKPGEKPGGGSILQPPSAGPKRKTKDIT